MKNVVEPSENLARKNAQSDIDLYLSPLSNRLVSARWGLSLTENKISVRMETDIRITGDLQKYREEDKTKP